MDYSDIMVVADGCDVMMIKGKLFACDVEMIIELMCDLFLLGDQSQNVAQCTCESSYQ